MPYIRKEERKMKIRLNYLKGNNKEKERARVLNNFYTRKIKNGKTTKADYFDKIFMVICIFIFVTFIISKLIGKFIIALFLSLTIMIIFIKNIIKINKKNRLIKVEEIKKEYKIKLEEEKIISDDEEIEDYIIERYDKKKSELKSNINFLGKDKIFKLYTLFIIFYLGSFMVKYSMYYKIIGIISFIMATLIGSYNLTEYIRKKDY